MLISQSEWARRKGFSRQYVNKLVRNGTIRLTENKVDTVQAPWPPSGPCAAKTGARGAPGADQKAGRASHR